MKKSLLSFFAVFPLIAFSQALTLSNARIDKGIDTDKGRITVTNNTSQPMEVMVKRNVVTLAPNHVTFFCWVQCYGPATDQSPEPIIIQPGESNENTFYGDVEHYGAIGETKVCYTFFDKNNPLTKAEECFVYRVGMDNIARVNQDFSDALQSPYPNPARSNAKIGYDLTNKSYRTAVINVRNLAGAVVRVLKLDTSKGEVNLSTVEMANGIYTYSLVVDEKAVLTKRLIVAN